MTRRNTKVLSFSLPPETADKIEDLSKSEHRSKSELLREMVRVYEEHIAESEWRELYEFGEETAKRLNIKDEDELLRILNETA